MLPSVNPQQRHKLPNDRILILHPSSAKFSPPSQIPNSRTHSISPHPNAPRLLILHQPSPPTPLNPRQFRIHHLLQIFHAPKRRLDLLPQLPARRLPPTTAPGRQVLPKQAVVDVPAAVEIDEGLQGDLLGDGVRATGGGGGGGGGLQLAELGGEVVEGVDVGGVVVFVVELHDAAGDGGLEGGVVV